MMFPSLTPNQDTTVTSTMEQTQPTTTTTSTALSIMSSPVFNYKAELNCLSTKIETKLTKHFEALFAQMDKKIDDMIHQHASELVEQEKVNIQVAKQLSFLVENMKRFIWYAPLNTPNTPLPTMGMGSA